MIDHFLSVAYDESVKTAEQDALVEAMKKLPVEVLYKIASGGQELSIKTGTGLEWLEQFKDTPLFQKAVELEQQCIQIEVARQAQCEKDSAMRESEPKYWEMEQKLHLQKKLLGLELAMSQLQQQQGGAAGSPQPAAPPASPPAPGPMPPSGEQGAGAMGNDGPPKVASAEEKKMASEQVTLAISMGQKLAHADARRADQFQAGRGLGEIMAKMAFDPKMLASLGQKAVGFAQQHPGAALGGALGAAGGLAHGLKKDEHGQRHLLGGLAEGAAGGAAGAAIGHVGQGTRELMGHGLSLGEAAQTAGGALKDKIQSGASNLLGNASSAMTPIEHGAAKGMGSIAKPATSMPAAVKPSAFPAGDRATSMMQGSPVFHQAQARQREEMANGMQQRMSAALSEARNSPGFAG